MPSMGTVLIVEDDDQVRRVLCLACEGGHYRVLTAATGTEALREVQRAHLDVILLDVSLPDISGLEVCRQLRSAGNTTPVIMVSGLSDLVDVVVGIEVGADDYVRKPFQVRELLARIASQVRRHRTLAGGTSETFELPGLVIDRAARRVIRDGEEVTLTAMQFDLLVMLAGRRGEVVSRDEVLEVMWRRDECVDARTVDAHVHRLRRRIDSPGRPGLIETVAGIGYRLSARAAEPGDRPDLHVVA